MIFDFIKLDQKDGALWKQIYRQLAGAAEEGRIPPGARLPSIRELAGGLSVSRSPVENAYSRLQLEGYIASRPKSGYYTLRRRRQEKHPPADEEKKHPVKYDMSRGHAAADKADIDAWRRCLRSALARTQEMTSCGDPCGEPELRRELAAYTYRARGVDSCARAITIASGTQQLLSLLLRSLGRCGEAVLENPGFRQGERVLLDHGWRVRRIPPSDDTAERLDGADIYIEIPSNRPAETAAQRTKRRRGLARWARESGHIIIEDDYNGELRYITSPVPAIQPAAPDAVVYIGSFSQLLLPSVRIAYMAAPPAAAEKVRRTAQYYDPTAGKAEQLALAAYIHSGELDRRLRRARRTYLRRSRTFAKALADTFGGAFEWRLLETATAYAAETADAKTAQALASAAHCGGVKIDAEQNSVIISFSAVREEDAENALSALAHAWGLKKSKK